MEGLITIKNVKTEKVYTVSAEGWAKIEAQGWASRYTIIDRRKPIDKATPTFLPKEIAEKAKSAAAKALEEGAKEQPGTDGARQS